MHTSVRIIRQHSKRIDSFQTSLLIATYDCFSILFFNYFKLICECFLWNILLLNIKICVNLFKPISCKRYTMQQDFIYRYFPYNNRSNGIILQSPVIVILLEDISCPTLYTLSRFSFLEVYSINLLPSSIPTIWEIPESYKSYEEQITTSSFHTSLTQLYHPILFIFCRNSSTPF